MTTTRPKVLRRYHAQQGELRTEVDELDNGRTRWRVLRPDVAGSWLILGTGTLEPGYDELELAQAIEAVRMAALLDPEAHQ